MLNRPLPTWVVLTVTAVLALGLAWKTLDPVYDPDTWWHLKVGEWVAKNGRVPEVDPFSRMSRENPTPWVAYSWLYEVGLYELDVSTAEGIYLLRAALVGLSAAALLGFVRWRFGATGLGAVVAGAMTATLLPLTMERPWHFTIAFTTVTLAAVTVFREGGSVRRTAWLPLVFTLWANLHIQFVLGWGILGLACLFPGKAKRWPVIGLTVASVLAVLVNPYHVRLLGVVWEYATQAQALLLVRELQPPSWKDPVAWVVVGLMVAAFHASARRRDWFAVLLVAAGAFFALRMQRDLWFGVLTAAAGLGANPNATAARRWGLGMGVTVLVGSVAGHVLTGDRNGNAIEYPFAAVEYVREHKPPGPLFNIFNWGGYFISELPNYPVSIDGRTNLYGNERVLRNYRTLTGEPDWESDPDLRSANLAILPADCPLTGWMKGSKEWTVAYEDGTAVVFRR